MIKLLPALLLSTAAIAPAYAEEPAVAATTPAAPSAKDPNRPICRTFAVTGSLTRKEKVCMTQAQWETKRHDQGSELEQRQVMRGVSGGG